MTETVALPKSAAGEAPRKSQRGDPTESRGDETIRKRQREITTRTFADQSSLPSLQQLRLAWLETVVARHSENGTVCILCGEKVANGMLLTHKKEVHGEYVEPPLKVRARKPKKIWTQIYSGGLPSLGKRK